MDDHRPDTSVDRKEFLRRTGALGVAGAATLGFPLLEARAAGAAPLLPPRDIIAAGGGATVKIGHIDGFSGVYAAASQSQQHGLEVAVAEAMKKNNRIKYEIVKGDDASKPANGTTEAKRLISQDKVDVLTGCLSSAVGLAVSATAEENNTFFLAIGTHDTNITGPKAHRVTFRQTTSNAMLANAIGPELLKHGKKWYFLVADYAFGTDGAARLKKILLAHGGQVVGEDLHKLGETDYSSYLTKARNTDADVLFFSNLKYHFKQAALFGEATYSVNDRFDITGGLRGYDFKEDRTQTFDGIFAAPGTTVGSTKANGVAPRIMASYKLSDTTRLNAQASKGFRLGGINDPLNTPLCTPADLVTFGGRSNWKDETLWNYEVGEKSRIMDGKGSVNVSAFYADITDLQATVTAGSCSSRLVFNVPKSKATGVEGEFELAPSDRFDFAVSASQITSKLESTLTSTDSTGTVSVVAGIQKGNRLPTVPQFQMAAAATLHWTMNQMAGYATGVYQHVGDRFTQIGDQAAGFGTVSLTSFAPHNIGGPYTQNTFTFNPKLPAYDILNLRIGILKNRWDTALFVNNVTNENALLALDQERGTRARVGYLTNQPRTVGISTRVNF